MKPYINFFYKLPYRGRLFPGIEPLHSTTEDVGTTWDQIRAKLETPTWGPLEPVRMEWPSHAWPGGYPLYYITKDCGVLSPQAANENIKLTLGDDPQWQIVSVEINYEDQDLVCDHLGIKIEAAYPSEEEACG